MKFNKKDLKKNKFIQSLKKFANNNIITKLIIGIIMWVCILIPTYLYFITRHLINPFGFWEEITLLVTFVIGLGWLQGILLFFGIYLTFILIYEDL